MNSDPENQQIFFSKNIKKSQLNQEPIASCSFQKNDLKVIVESNNNSSLLLIKPKIITKSTQKQKSKSADFESNRLCLLKTNSCQDNLALDSCQLFSQQCHYTKKSTEFLNDYTNLKKINQQRQFGSFCSITKPKLYIKRFSNFRLLNLKCQDRLNSFRLKTSLQQKRFSNIELETKFLNENKGIMLSLHSATWAIVLVQLVLSAAALIASVSIVSAQAQSISRFGVSQKPR